MIGVGSNTCGCSNDWRVVALTLEGERKRFLNVLSFSFEEKLNEPGNGSVTMYLRDVKMNDIWPHATKIAFLRIAGGHSLQGNLATPSDPVCEWVGLVESVQADSDGTVTVGLNSIEKYLDYRLVGTLSLNTRFTEIGKALVEPAGINGTRGIPLVAEADVSVFGNHTRNYKASDYGTILARVLELTQVLNGPDYVLTHSPDGAIHTMRFTDWVGKNGIFIYPLDVRAGINSYSLDVNGENHVNRVIGTGETASLRYDADAGLSPLFERSEQYSGVSRSSTVESRARGSLENYRSPSATPSITVAGIDRLVQFGIGDTINLRMGDGAIQYDGQSRLVGIAWSVSSDSPTTATLTFLPMTDGEGAVLNAPPDFNGCCVRSI